MVISKKTLAVVDRVISKHATLFSSRSDPEREHIGREDNPNTHTHTHARTHTHTHRERERKRKKSGQISNKKKRNNKKKNGEKESKVKMQASSLISQAYVCDGGQILK